MNQSSFVRLVHRHRTTRHWSIAELARRAGLTQPEVSRVLSGQRMPTLRHVKGFSEAFSAAPTAETGEPTNYEKWLSILADLGERARFDARSKKDDSV
jgi:transcriptional regulator with XRE-family HTH domain